MIKKESISDEKLVRLAQSGDKQAEERLLLRYRDMVRYCSRKFFLCGGESEDLVQEGMMGLFQAVGAYRERDGGATFKNFAYMCILRRIIDAVKTAAKKNPSGKIFLVGGLEDMQVKETDPDEGMIYVEEMRELMQKMSRVLSNLEFRIFTMYMNGVSVSEISETTGRNIKSVDNALQRSKNKLLKMMEQENK